MIITVMDNMVIKIDIEKMLSRYSLLCGILAFLLCFNSFKDGMYDGFVLGAAAVVLSAVSKKGGEKRTGAKFGMALGIISILFSVFLYYGFSMFYTLTKDPVNGPQFLSMIEELLQNYGMKLEDFLYPLRSVR